VLIVSALSGWRITQVVRRKVARRQQVAKMSVNGQKCNLAGVITPAYFEQRFVGPATGHLLRMTRSIVNADASKGFMVNQG
jgi:hypothetical protein